MRQYLPLLTSCLFVSILVLATTKAQAPSSDWAHFFEGAPILAGGEKAWIVQEPKVVSAGYVESMAFGPGPNGIVTVTRPKLRITPASITAPDSEKPVQSRYQVNLYNWMNPAAAKSISLPPYIESVDDINWISQERVLAISARTKDEPCEVLVDVIGGSMVSTYDINRMSGENFDLAVKSRIPTAAILWSYERHAEQGKSKLCVIDFSAKPPAWRVVELPSGTGIPMSLTQNGTLVLSNPAGGYVEYSLSDGSIKPLKQDADNYELDSPEDAELGPGYDIKLQDDPNPGVWLVTSPGLRSQMRLTKEADLVMMNTSGTGVLFRTLGAAFFSELTPIDLEAAKRKLLAQAKTNAMNMAKQAGTAMQIYAADYDDILPFSGASVTESVYPYIKSEKILKMVVWNNISGQNLSKLDSPASYELGYLPGPGGRAIIYADGHVGWLPDSK